MARTVLEASASAAPHLPGVYRFLDGAGRILYIGKALDIAKRLRGHLGCPGDERHRLLLSRAHAVEWTVTRSEVEALVLEAELVRMHKPPLNVRLRADQRFPYLEVTTDEKHPRLVVTRRIDRSRDIPRFGPYPDARNLRALVDFLQDAYPLRRCSIPVPRRTGRKCVMGQMSRCPAPCVSGESESYGENVAGVLSVLRGDWAEARAGIERRMVEASASMRYEEAAKWRDLCSRLDSFGWPAPESARDMVCRDVVAVEENWGIVLQMRSGRFTGTVRLPFESRWRLAAPPERLAVLLRSYYSETGGIPGEVLLREKPQDARIIEDWLSSRRGRRVRLVVPVRGPGRELVELAVTDLRHFLARLAWRRPGGSRERVRAALEALADVFGLDAPPSWMVALDASSISGGYPVAALVSFRDGKPDKAGYRRFSMPPGIGRNDPAMIADAVARYLSHLEGEKPSFFLVDGGITQHRAAERAAGDAGRGILFVSIAKREESLIAGPTERRVNLPPDSPPVILLRAMRDEVHRFVVGYHRLSRSRGETRSGLEDIPGIGPRLRALLLSRFGSLERLRAATEDDLMQVPGVGRARARQLLRHLGEAGNEG